jgi:hypothetical protein
VRCGDLARRFEQIAGFKSETDASEWIAKSFQNWLDDRKNKDAL